MRAIFVLFICVLSVNLAGQTEVWFQNKALKKILHKEGIHEFSNISEIALTDSLQQNSRIAGRFFEIKSKISQYKYIYTGRVNSCRAGGCSISVEVQKRGATEYFDYFILFDENKAVRLVKVFNYQATHGHEITAKGWLKQFIGHDGSEDLQVDKNIDAISGATISVYAITIDIEMKTKLLQKIQ